MVNVVRLEPANSIGYAGLTKMNSRHSDRFEAGYKGYPHWRIKHFDCTDILDARKKHSCDLRQRIIILYSRNKV